MALLPNWTRSPTTLPTCCFINLLEEDDKWLTENYNKLIQQYPGQMVAINDGKVVAVGREVRAYCATRKKAALVGPLLINVPDPDDLGPFLI